MNIKNDILSFNNLLQSFSNLKVNEKEKEEQFYSLCKCDFYYISERIFEMYLENNETTDISDLCILPPSPNLDGMDDIFYESYIKYLETFGFSIFKNILIFYISSKNIEIFDLEKFGFTKLFLEDVFDQYVIQMDSLKMNSTKMEIIQ